MPEDCVPCETLTTVPHMLYASRLYPLKLRQQSSICSMPQDRTFTLSNSNDSPTHALCLKILPSEAQTLKHAVPYICSMPHHCMFTLKTQTTVPHKLYAWRLCTLWNSNACSVIAYEPQSDTCSIAEDRIPQPCENHFLSLKKEEPPDKLPKWKSATKILM